MSRRRPSQRPRPWLVRRANAAPRPPKALHEDQVERLLALLRDAPGAAARRDDTLAVLLLSTGIRIGSALDLDVDDVDLDAGELTLRRCKGDRQETAFLPREVRDMRSRPTAAWQSGSGPT